MTKEDLAQRLRATFLLELEEQVRTMSADLLALEETPTDAERLKSLFRSVHSLKGAARAVGEPFVETACHELESLLALVREGRMQLGPTHFRLFFRAVDALTDAGERIATNVDLADAPIAELGRSLRSMHGGQGEVTSLRSPDAAPKASAPPTSPPPAPATPREPPAAAGGDTQLRLAADKLDAVIASVDQLRLAASRLTAQSAQVQELDAMASRVLGAWRAAARQVCVEGTAAEPGVTHLVDRMNELLAALARSAARAATSTTNAGRQLTRAVDETVARVHRMRLRPFGDIVEGLPRVVRDLSSEQGRQVQLRSVGAEVEADRALLDALREPLVQLVRNAVDHGIEAPGAREAAGKPALGTVRIAAELRGDRLIVITEDDGAGVNVRALRRRLAAAGMADTSDAAIAAALFESGVSSREETSAISGRGVGLDVVRTAVERIGGTASVQWTEGGGTTFTLDCPLTIATLRAVIVTCSAHLVAIPTTSVERLLRVTPADLRAAEGRDVLPLDGALVPVVPLARVLGPPFTAESLGTRRPAIVMHAGGRRVGVLVDEVRDECELMLRPVDSGRMPLPLVAGAASLPSGEVVPVVSAPAVVAAGLRERGAVVFESVEAAPRKRILVVDDSITTRVLEQSVLEAAGYYVTTAVDGVEGWRLLQERGADLVISDVEMPGMDGFALCESIRASPRFARLPVILVTGLESEAHRSRGLAAGADAYIGKSTFDQRTLLDVVEQILT